MIFGEIYKQKFLSFVLLFLFLVGKLSNFISFILFHTGLIVYS